MEEKLTEEDLLNKIKELEDKIHALENDLSHDKLTQAKTRDFFERKSKGYLEETEKINQGKRREWGGFKDISFLFVDIDQFKNINDTYGHSVGDEVLKEVAREIKKSLRIGDIVSRWGGEEFVAILLGSDESQSKIKAEEIRKTIESMGFGEGEVKVTISIGVAGFAEGIAFEDLIKRADKALYRAKETGRNKVVAFSEIRE